MQLFYNKNIQSGANTFIFDKEESKHIMKVLRKKEGDTLHITNGNGFLFTAIIQFASEKKCNVAITKETFVEKPEKSLHIAIAPTKMNDRMEWFLEKATEIGIQEITPIICDNSERKVYKTDRAEKIVQAAMKQSLQYYLPKINPPISFLECIKKDTSNQKYIAHCEDLDKKEWKNETFSSTTTILIGPEGDFSSKEIQSAVSNNFVPVSLGNTRLRTETAALVACHTFVLNRC